MRLIKQCVTRLMQEYDEGRINKEFPVWTYYQAIQLCALVLGEKLPDDIKINKLYSLYTRARRNGDKTKINHYISLLKAEMMKDKIYFDKFEAKFKELNIQDETYTDLWHNDAVGYLAFEDEGG